MAPRCLPAALSELIIIFEAVGSQQVASLHFSARCALVLSTVDVLKTSEVTLHYITRMWVEKNLFDLWWRGVTVILLFMSTYLLTLRHDIACHLPPIIIIMFNDMPV